MSQDLIERLRDEANRLQADGGEGLASLLDEARERCEQQAAQIERLRKDAERHRWLRIDGCGDTLPGELDAAIDAAMLAATPKEPT
jgi:hypothetical protein